MFTEMMIAVLYSNKSFDNPILGKMSCDVLRQTYKQCKKNHAFKETKQTCEDLKYLQNQCYTASKPQDFNQTIMQEFKQALNTVQFFQSRQSIIAEKLFTSSWAVFYNRNNLKKYENYLQKLQAAQNQQNY